jgi:hypothetical protein
MLYIFLWAKARYVLCIHRGDRLVTWVYYVLGSSPFTKRTYIARQFAEGETSHGTILPECC